MKTAIYVILSFILVIVASVFAVGFKPAPPTDTTATSTPVGTVITIIWNPATIPGTVVEVNMITKQILESHINGPLSYALLTTSTTTNSGEYDWTVPALNGIEGITTVYIEIGCYQSQAACQALPLFGPYNIN